MTTSDSASFALDAVQRQAHRLDAIQDHLAGTRTPASAAADADEENATTMAKLEATINAQISQTKTLPDTRQVQGALHALQQATVAQQTALLLPPPSGSAGDAEAAASTAAVVQLMAAARLTYTTYGLVLDALVQQAEAVHDQAWFWTEVEEDTMQTATYLVQTLPARTVNLVTELAKRLSDTTLTTTSSTSSKQVRLNADTLRQAWRLVRDSPVIAIGALFPLSVHKPKPRAGVASSTSSSAKDKRAQLVSAARILTPLGLTRHEARTKRATLARQRDAMATQLGTLAQALAKVDGERHDEVSAQGLRQELWERVEEMQEALADDGEQQPTTHDGTDLPNALQALLATQLVRRQQRVDQLLSAAPVGLGLPSRLARLWPWMVLGPLTTIVGVRIVTRSWDTIVAKAYEARDTLHGFAVNWLYDPCVKLLDTIRTGDQDGMLVTPESLNSDLQSLERMVTDFTAEKYGLTGEALEKVSARVREGDLTTVLRIYETELKSPFKSAVSGSLVRSLLIQIQKVKVDIAVAMRGVDQLLKSQQLLFGAIGIAPAMAVVYFAGGFVRARLGMALGSQGRRAGQSTRYRAWQALRRIDRLLADPQLAVGPLPALTQGLLLLDLALLRKLAPQLVAQVAAGRHGGTHGSHAKRLRAEFMHDVRDLEAPSWSAAQQPTSLPPGLGWQARRAAVDRMWRSWSACMSLGASA